ncbi:MAG: 5-nitroimidazole antibiotic resistance protein [Fusobacteria bacterium]|nr:MAG: 5-nitroimidazole antibiotic resistance protein [Fusobacteriota bacterium]KAF0229152.1 MAG: 5-nitroimidazole antibiotic resistance [Fusobacteriota bacterium]
MRRKDKEISEIDEVIKIIEDSKVMHLGLSNNNLPYVIPLNFGFQYDGNIIKIYFHSAKVGKKIDFINSNNKCAVEMTSYFELEKGETACQWSAFHKSIMIEGNIFLVENEEEIKNAMDLLMKRYGFEGIPIYEEKYLKAMAVYCIEVESISGKRNMPKI